MIIDIAKMTSFSFTYNTNFCSKTRLLCNALTMTRIVLQCPKEMDIMVSFPSGHKLGYFC